MKPAVFITARTESTRLPRKALLEIKGKKLIEHLIERVKSTKLPDLIVLSTTINPNDKTLVEIAKEYGIQYFRGSEKDILDRHLNAALKYNVDFIVNVDGDDIFCEPSYIDKVIERFNKTKADVIQCEGLPLGAAPFGFTFNALKKVCWLKDEVDTETGWGRYFTDSDLFKVEHLEVEDEELRHPEIRMTIDYPEDFEFVKEIFDRLYTRGNIFTLRDILVLLKSNPEIIKMNKNVRRIYWKYFEKHSRVRIKSEK